MADRRRYTEWMPARFAKKLLAWYAVHGRDLPWRRTSDPYAIWVSETMLQQTRVETVLPYYARWVERFPTLASLAEADLSEVLRLWEGLGYYRRAHHLHAAARQVVQQRGGRLPTSIDGWRELPGVGPYTAAAVAAIACQVDVLALDGNLRRVLARVLDLDLDVRTPQGERLLRAFGQAHLPAGRAADFNQALMDLGALICTSRGPVCGLCPLLDACQARRHDRVLLRPVRRQRRRPVSELAAAAVLWRNGEVLVGQRPADGLLAGMWEFPGGRLTPAEPVEAGLARHLQERLGVTCRIGVHLGWVSHAYTHFSVNVSVHQARILKGRPRPIAHRSLRWASPQGLAELPMGKIDRTIAGWLQAPLERRGARRALKKLD
jgi:A/G-specific adenine glycosylase